MMAHFDEEQYGEDFGVAVKRMLASSICLNKYEDWGEACIGIFDGADYDFRVVNEPSNYES